MNAMQHEQHSSTTLPVLLHGGSQHCQNNQVSTPFHKYTLRQPAFENANNANCLTTVGVTVLTSMCYCACK